jgi:hypothetical protein
MQADVCDWHVGWQHQARASLHTWFLGRQATSAGAGFLTRKFFILIRKSLFSVFDLINRFWIF